MRKRYFLLALALPACGTAQTPARPTEVAQAQVAALPTGDIHDFDWAPGSWTLANRRLKARNVGSHEWEEFPSYNRTSQYLGGMVNIDQMDMPTKGFSGLTLRVFNPETRQWSIYWINSKVGRMDPPQVGGFTGNRGEFYGEDVDNGHPVKVRYIWTKTGPDTAHWEQAFSYDGGRTWETNWMNDLTRTGR
ncbi:hypothetical protein LZC95_02245 [Pendulispora brunnea]|uniref:DUF1579 domain-containing protein n=1 Tax=Pendulispora brunnea TaxID=2905690 RepID=A0ABZ2KDT6_9BACT